jgi:hypothetical protein
MYVSSTLMAHVVWVLMVYQILESFLSLIPFQRADSALVLECYDYTDSTVVARKKRLQK